MFHLVNAILLVKVYAAFCMDAITKDLVTPVKQFGESCGYASCNPGVKGRLNIHVVPHTHGELGQTQTFDSYYTGHDTNYEPTQKNMKRILDYTITELWAKPHRKFSLSDMPYFFHWWSKRDETVRRMVYELVRQGRLSFVGGGWSISDESTTSYHALIDHFTYSLRKLNSTFLECGRALAAWQATASGHSRALAGLLPQMGFDALFLAPVGYDDELDRLRRKEMEFLWRGNDDLGAETDIFTSILFDGVEPPPGFCFSSLCEDPLLVSSSDVQYNLVERAEVFIESMLYRQSPYYSTNNVMVVMGGRMAYFDASMWFENIDKLIESVNGRATPEKNVYAFYSTPACYLKAVYDEGPTLRTKQDDFHPHAIGQTSYASGAFTSRPSLKYLAREGHRYLQIAKQIHATAELGNWNKLFEDLHWINGVFQDHNIITGALRPHVKDYYVHKMDKTIQQSMLLIQEGINKLRGSPAETKLYRCQFNISACINTMAPQGYVVVYNPLAWPVTIPIRLPIDPGDYLVYSPQEDKLTAALMPVPPLVQNLPGRQNKWNFNFTAELVFIAHNIPPMGYRSYHFQWRELGWIRPKRALIKKIKQKKPKKYLVRQANAPGEVLFEDDYEYFDDISTTAKYDENILQRNITGDIESLYDDVNDVINATESTTKGIMTTVSEATTTKPTRTTTTTTTTTLTTPTTTPTDEYSVTEQTSDWKEDDEIFNTTHKHWWGYFYSETKDLHIRNKYLRVDMDSSRRVSKIRISNVIEMEFKVEMFYYVSDDPDRLGKKGVNPPGAYVFRSMDNKQEPINQGMETKVFKNKMMQEIQCTLSPYAGYTLRVYRHSPVLEVDWIVGPIPVEDGLGKDVFIKYVTDLDNEGVFYTDSNGRQTLKRIRNRRPTYEALNKDPVAGNIYPVTSKIYIEDLNRNIRLSVFNDRSQGGSSLKDGEVNLMLHRRLLTEDPIKENMNDTEFGKGVIIRGQHYLYISKADFKPGKVFEKKLAKEIELKPQIFVSSYIHLGKINRRIWVKYNNEFTPLKSKLPLGIHILTLQRWGYNTILLRLENYLEKSDTVLSGVKKVVINDLFKNLKFLNVKEATLSANMWLEDWTPLNWKSDKFYKSFNEGYGSNNAEYSDDDLKPLQEVGLDIPVELYPQQIRTFVLEYKYVNVTSSSG